MIYKYGRDEVEYESFYSSWMKDLASRHTADDLQRMLCGKSKEAARYAKAHLRALDATSSMTSQSQRRAQARNCAAAAGDYAIALRGALEIHRLFPEHAKAGNP